MKTKCEIYTRTVGYLRPTESMNDSKQAEVRDRHKYTNKEVDFWCAEMIWW